MRFNNRWNHRSKLPVVNRLGRGLRCSRNHGLACIATSAFLTCATLSGQQAPSPDPDKPQVTQQSDQPEKTPDSQGQKQTPKSVRAERENQILESNAKLLKLAADLKNEVDKTSFDTLSLGVIRKADEIEKLAHSVREKLKVTLEAAK